MSQPTSRRTVRVSKALVGLPCLHAALAEGRMSWEQICAAVRFATPETDAHLARILPGYSVEQIEALARQHRPRKDADENEAHRRRRFGWRPDHEAGGFKYSGFLPSDQASTINAVLSALAQAAGPVPETGIWDPFESRCADAFHALADQAAVDDTETAPSRRGTTQSSPDEGGSDGDAGLDGSGQGARPITTDWPDDDMGDESDDQVGAEAAESGSDPPSEGAPSAGAGPSEGGSGPTPAERMREMLDRGVGCHVSIHVDEDVLSGEVPGNGTLDGMSVGVGTVRRLLCDAQRSTTVEDAFGRAVGISRNAHDPPRWLRRQVLHRDGCCRFPGCSRRIRQVHHISWWTRDQGPTDAPNLAGLCWAHHRLVHEGGWTITGDADGTLTFTSPAGRTLTSCRQPTRRTTRAAARKALGLPDRGEPERA